MVPSKRKPIHPGEVLLEEFLKPLDISQQEFARHLGKSWTQPKISEIIPFLKSSLATACLLALYLRLYAFCTC